VVLGWHSFPSQQGEEPQDGLHLQLLDAHSPPAELSHWQAWKRGVLVPATRTAFQLSPGLGLSERARDGLLQQDQFLVALQAGKVLWAHREWRDILLEALETAALCTDLPPSLLREGHTHT